MFAGENLTAVARPEKTFPFGVISSTKTPFEKRTAWLPVPFLCFMPFFPRLTSGRKEKAATHPHGKTARFFGFRARLNSGPLDDAVLSSTAQSRSIFLWRFARHSPKRAVELRQRLKANIVGNLADPQLGIS